MYLTYIDILFNAFLLEAALAALICSLYLFRRERSLRKAWFSGTFAAFPFLATGVYWWWFGGAPDGFSQVFGALNYILVYVLIMIGTAIVLWYAKRRKHRIA